MSAQRTHRKRAPTTTLWSAGEALDRQMLDYTAGEDRAWDARLLRWDVLGSLGHVEGLAGSRLITPAQARRLRAGLRAALRAAERGTLRVDPGSEDVHTGVETWLTRRWRDAGERLHTARSRNDQIACDLRLYLKDTLLRLHDQSAQLVAELVRFSARHRTVLWPGYTHQRRAMPSTLGLWAAAYAEGLLDTMESLNAVWQRLDRCPLGSAAGYGVPLPLRREIAARALGFARVEHNVAAVQAGRGKLEAAVLLWCAELARELGKLSCDVILFSAEEYGYLRLPAALATGSSIMPHKRNPDLFELTRGRAAAVEADLVAVLHIAGKLPSGYHRDFQLLKEPLLRGLDRTGQMLAMVTAVLPRLEVDRARCAAAVSGGVLATDEVLRRVEQGRPFRAAYREVAAALRTQAAASAGAEDSPPAGAPATRAMPGGRAVRAAAATRATHAALLRRRAGLGGAGNLGLPAVRARLRACRRWSASERRRFDGALGRLAGRGASGRAHNAARSRVRKGVRSSMRGSMRDSVRTRVRKGARRGARRRIPARRRA
jgi:argininosuccinate lyase